MTPPFRQSAPSPSNQELPNDIMEGNDHSTGTDHHFSHADYDWMGILDTCLDSDHHRSYSFDLNGFPGDGRSHSDLQALIPGADNGHAEDGKVAASEVEGGAPDSKMKGEDSQDKGLAASKSVGHSGGPSCNGTTTQVKSDQLGQPSAVPDTKPSSSTSGAVVVTVPSAVSEAAAPQNTYQPAPSPATSTQSAPAKPPPSLDLQPSVHLQMQQRTEDEAKKNSRVERKRCREKQRRLDTNSQFSALAEIIREIETEDFVEEASILGWTVPNNPATAAAAGGAPAAAAVAAASAAAAAGHAAVHSVDPAYASKKFKTDYPSLNGNTKSGSSNRVDLIAKTCTVISQLRQIRRSRREELRDARRQNFEMKKEIEELRRAVAHYKAVGMGPTKPQEKVMMMVPMMVPQDAVNSLAAGYPAAHPIGGNYSSPWMPMATQQNAMVAMHPQTHPFAAGMHGVAAAAQSAPMAQMGPTPGVAGYTAFQNPVQYMNTAQAQGQPAAAPSAAQQPAAGQPASMPPTMNFAQQANAHTDIGAAAAPGATQALAPHPTTPTEHAPTPAMPNSAAMQMHPHPFPTAPPTMAMYPHMAHGVPTGVPFGMHPHMQTQAPVPSDPSNNSNHNNNSNNISIDTTAKPPAARTSSPPQGGGGNLAHCA